MFSNIPFPNTFLLAAPGVSDFENLHLIATLQKQQMNELYDPEPKPRSTPHSQREEPVMHRYSTIRELAVPFVIFVSFFALPIYTYMVIAA
ncbi:MAG: hypothetical protein HN712_25865 [Gemmatimonadetes bacterium]|jgi:hypothetical protein|nr:hypothetical protein [Gemmatimonadota bacterium]MBT6149327.1 hypothetical protein [Gemmatimonadota bacterium]MBT7863768.1 hypothetical protein [Gemmatimonadota bacterium]